MATRFPGDQPIGMVGRIKALLLQPKAEWARIDPEPASTGGLMTGWVAPLAAIGPVCQLIHSLAFGNSMFGVTYRPSIASALTTAILTYVMAFVSIWIFAQVINALAPNFGGTKSPMQAMKVAVYTGTAAWVAGIFQLIPGLGLLGLLGLYSFYLLWVGLPMLMKVPDDKAPTYTIVTIIVAAVLFVVVGAITGMVATRLVPMGAMDMGGGTVSGSLNLPGGAKLDLDKMQAASKQLAAAGQQVAAVGNGQPANGQVNGGTTPVAADILQNMLPASVGGFTRTQVSSSSGSAAGIGGSSAEGTYTAGSQSFTLKVTDMAAMGALAGLGGAMNIQSNEQTATGYEKTSTVNGQMINEKWQNNDHSGSYSAMVASRFQIEADGSAPSIDVLKGAVAAIDQGKLASLAK
jgi:hypothetical protein